ncbi:hypothetical protein [Rhizorhabdus wittichii]|uniref:hypothetical protein n=1 Tax=Rhizorhabdus wittichii TaxID=160791 RepID=UPI0012FD2F0B|nr:hypothetical protein [Rhizorhabdus wittichii]
MPVPMHPSELSFGDVEAILADIHNIASSKRTAFQARLKNMIRVGFPGYSGAGRGRRGKFGALELTTMALGVEFSQLGLAPGHVAKIMIDHWSTIMLSIGLTIEDNPSTSQIELADEALAPSLLLFDPAALWPLMDDVLPNDVDYASASFEHVSWQFDVQALQERTSVSRYRTAVINVTALVTRLAMAFSEQGNFRGFLWELDNALHDELQRPGRDKGAI